MMASQQSSIRTPDNKCYRLGYSGKGRKIGDKDGMGGSTSLILCDSGLRRHSPLRVHTVPRNKCAEWQQCVGRAS